MEKKEDVKEKTNWRGEVESGVMDVKEKAEWRGEVESGVMDVKEKAEWRRCGVRSHGCEGEDELGKNRIVLGKRII